MADLHVLALGLDSRPAVAGARDYVQATSRVQRENKKTEGSVKKVTKAIAGLAAGISTMVAAQKAIKIVAAFEDGLVGVGKTADITGSELQALGDDFVMLSTRMPASVETLLEIGQAAGQLGVKGSENILLFSETIAKLGRASDLSGEMAAKSLARMLNVTGESIGTVDVLASVIVELGNNAAASEREIAKHATQVAQASAVYDVTSAQAAALGATMAEIGLRAELSGSAIGRTMRAIDSATRDGGRAMKVLSDVTGLTRDQMREVFERDSVEALRIFLRGLQDVINEGGNVSAVLSAMKLESVELMKAILPVAKNVELLEKNLTLASEELRNVGALEKEAAAAGATMSSEWQKLINTAKAAVLTNRGWGATLTEGIRLMRDVAMILFDIDGAQKEASNTAKVLAGALEVVLTYIVALAATKLAWVILEIAGAMWKAATAAGALSAAMAAHPYLLMAAAVTALAYGMGALESHINSLGQVAERVESPVLDLTAAFDELIAVRGRFARAMAADDLEQQASALTREIRVMEGALDRIRGEVLSDPGASPRIGVAQLARFLGLPEDQQGFDDLKWMLVERAQRLYKETGEGVRFAELGLLGPPRPPGRSGRHPNALNAALREGFGFATEDLAMRFGMDLGEVVKAQIDRVSLDRRRGVPAETAFALMEERLGTLRAQATRTAEAMRETVEVPADADLVGEEAQKARDALADLMMSHQDELAVLERVRDVLGDTTLSRADYQKLVAREGEVVKALGLLEKADLSNKDETIAKLNALIDARSSLSDEMERGIRAAEEEARAEEARSRLRQTVSLTLQALRAENEVLTTQNELIREQGKEVEGLRGQLEVALTMRRYEAELTGLTNEERQTLLASLREELQLRASLRGEQSDLLAPDERDRPEPVDSRLMATARGIETITFNARDADSALQAVEGTLTDIARISFREGVIDPAIKALTKGADDVAEAAADAGQAAALEASGVAVAGSMTAGAASAAGTLTGAGSTLSASMIAGATQAAAILGGAGVAAGVSPSALGAVYRSGLLKFADGGVFDRPTLFPTRARNVIGMLGEAGPEAIMPLKRGPDGKLGVGAPEGGRGGTMLQVSFGDIVVDTNGRDFLSLPISEQARIIGDRVAQAYEQNPNLRRASTAATRRTL